MAQKNSARFRRSQHALWTFVLLIALAMNFWIFTCKSPSQEFWAMILNMFLAGINIITVLFQLHSQPFAEARSFIASYFSAAHKETEQQERLPHLNMIGAILVFSYGRDYEEASCLAQNLQPIKKPIKVVSTIDEQEILQEALVRSFTTVYPGLSSLRSSTEALLTTPAYSSFAHDSRVGAGVLLVSVTDPETRGLLRVFPDSVKTVIQNRTYYDLGIVGNTKTYLVQATGMGPAEVRPCIEDGIRVHRPAAVVLVGIAFGLHADQQQLGDVLVSRQVHDYGLQRWGTGPDQQLVIRSRGNRVTATEWLLDRFAAGKYDWKGSVKVHMGLLLSSSLLIDHNAAREQLLQFEPEALGGEMEGTALLDIAQRHHTGWIVVKAISDWADGKKQQQGKDQQQHTAENAARFVRHVISHPDFLRKE